MKEPSRAEGYPLRRRLVVAALALALALTLNACFVQSTDDPDKTKPATTTTVVDQGDSPTASAGDSTTTTVAKDPTTTDPRAPTTAGPPSTTTTTAPPCTPAVGAGAPEAVMRAMAETIADVGDGLECPSDQSREATGGVWWQWFPKQAALVVGAADGRGSVLYGPSVAALVDHDAAFSDTRDFTALQGVPTTRLDCFNGDVIVFLDDRFHVVALLGRPSKRNGKEAVQPILILPAMVDDWVTASRSLDTFIFPTSDGDPVDGTLSQQFGSFGERSAPESAEPTKTMLIDEVAHLCGRGDVPLLPSQVFPRVGPR